MSTVAKGNAFEGQIFHKINSMLQNDELPLNGRYCQVFQKKGYYSEKRKSNIIIDISVECTLPGESSPSMYLMIECKNYNHSIPVDDIEEFYAKTQQITGLNVKAILFTTHVLQEGALNFAQSSGIRVMRIKPDGEHEVLSFRKERTSISKNSKDFVNAILALTSPIKSEISPNYIGLGAGKVYQSFVGLFEDAIFFAE